MNTKLPSPPDTREDFKESLRKIQKVCLHNPTEGLGMIEAFYADCKENINELQEAGIWSVIGVGHHVGKNYTLSLSFFEKALQIFENHTDIEKKIGTQNWMALVYKAIGNPEKAMPLLFSSLQLSQQNGFELLEYRAHTCLGSVYQSIYNSSKAIECFENALLLSPSDERAIALSNLASNYSNSENHPKALEYLEEAYELRHTSGILMNSAYITANLVITLGELRKYDDVLPKLKELNELAKELKGTYFIHLYHNALIGLYLRCRESAPKPVVEELLLHIDIGATVNYLEEKIKSPETNHLRTQLNACHLLIAYYELDKNWKQIAFYQKKQIDFNTQKNEKERMETTERLHIKHEVAQKEQKIKIQELELEKREIELKGKKELERINLQLEETVAKRTAKLTLQNQQLREFAFIVSHDLREPLCNIHGITDLLVATYKGKMDEEMQMFVSQIGNSAQYMNRLLKDLLDYTTLEKKIEEEGFQKVDSAEIWKEVKESLDLEIAESQAHIEENGLPIFQTSMPVIRLLFENLLSNALKFKSPNKPANIKIHCLENKDNYQFSITDNGIGINLSHQERIFRAFQRLQNNDSQGTGIGLAICKKAVETLGGTIWVESKLGAGSVFYFTIKK
ncbi:MAG: ATP-binding protein [Chitinophagales bacterium]